MTDAERARRNGTRDRVLASERRAALLRHGLIGTCMLVAVVMLASFYSIVSGAVDRASRQRLAAAEGGNTPTLAPVSRVAHRGVALQGNGDLVARAGN